MFPKLIKDNFETPVDVFNKYGSIHNLHLDVCATAENTKCQRYYSLVENGLKQNWGGRIWMNPPYSNVAPWVAKAYRSRNMCEIIVCLLPASTDTKWFHSFVYRKAGLLFIKGRISFEYKNTTYYHNRYPLMVAIYRPDNIKFSTCPYQTELDFPW